MKTAPIRWLSIFVSTCFVFWRRVCFSFAYFWIFHLEFLVQFAGSNDGVYTLKRRSSVVQLHETKNLVTLLESPRSVRDDTICSSSSIPYASARLNEKAMKWQTHATSCKITLLDSIECVCAFFSSSSSSSFDRSSSDDASQKNRSTDFQAGGINFK